MATSLPTVGTRVRFRVDHDIYPHCIIPAGTVGFVVEMSPECIWVLPTSKNFPELDTNDWHGRIQLYDHGADGVEEFATIVDAALEVIEPDPFQTLAQHLGSLALNAAAKLIQDILGVESGDFAGQYFADDTCEEDLAAYAHAEIADIAHGLPLKESAS